MTTINNSTQFIHIESKEYPIYLNQIRRRHPEVSIATNPREESLAALGYAVVHDSPRPTGDVVEQGDPVEVNGRYEKGWTVREFTQAEAANRLEQARTAHLEAISQYEASYLERGFPYEFGENTYHIQLRDGDIGRITGFRVKADELIALGITDPVMEFRVYENVVVKLTPAEASAMADAAFTGYTAFLRSIWDLKDLTRLAEREEEFPEIPVL